MPTKEELRAAADALFEELSEELSVKKAPKKQKSQKSVSATSMPRPAPVSEGLEANRMAELMSANSSWKPVAVVAIVVIQSCRCCHGDTEYLGNTLVRFINKNNNIQWDHVIPEGPEHVSLPHKVDTFYQNVEQCPSCVRFNLHLSDIAAIQQLNLFH